MYKIIMPFDTQGFLLDANVLKLGFKDSKIYISGDVLPKSYVNIFIDRGFDIKQMDSAEINILSANQEAL